MLISRVAERCFWLGRYLERVESMARSLEAQWSLDMGADVDDALSWLPIIIVAGEEERFEAELGRAAAEDGERVQEYMVWDRVNPSRIEASVAAVRENARGVRDVTSLEVWEAINELHLWMRRTARQVYREDRHEFYEQILRRTVLVGGFLESSMLRDEAFDFIELGACLERACQTSRLLDVNYHQITVGKPHVVVRTALWLALLRACAGTEPFMRRHRGHVSEQGVASFMLLEPRFPRSVGYALREASARLESIRPPLESVAEGESRRGERSAVRLGKLEAWLGDVASRPLAQAEIHAILTDVVDEIHAICDEVTAEFLGYEGIDATSAA
jgi:uncharacterized alpha-E superfamily protein